MGKDTEKKERAPSAPVTKVLVANRGEIAVRVIRACRELSLPTVAVYSTADRRSLHVQMADQAVEIGPPAARESYLRIDAIVDAARRTGADAVHPGYGFLSENPDFASACGAAGLTFIGPPPEAIRLLGNKIAARELAIRNDVPVVPGTQGQGLTDAQIIEQAELLGFPVLLKAAAGGGGKGMRVVCDPADLPGAVEAARRVALGAFGDDSVFVEKLVERPRHVEFQVFADAHGHAAHLFERECSIQRRHQKVVEETPSPAVTPELRARMGEAAVRLVRAAGYVNAGTVEFLLAQDGSFFFLEVNTRIQVEHPVTEMVVGVDLVQEQIRVARGEELSFSAATLSQRGHAIQARVYAENPAQDFLPSPGQVLCLAEPSGPGIRNDCGVRQGDQVSVYYDPIVSKLIAWAPTRGAAIERLRVALDEYVILGIDTTIPFLRQVIDHPAFRAGQTHTSFLGEHFADWKDARMSLRDVALVAAALQTAASAGCSSSSSSSSSGPRSPWATVGPWEIGKGA